MSNLYPELEFDAATHTYTYKGRVVPSVTQVLQRVGVCDDSGRWEPVGFNPRFCDDRDAKRAAEFGSAFHKIAAAKLLGQDVKYPPEMQPYVDVFDRFCVEWKLEPHTDGAGNVLVEMPMYHEKYGYAGTPDFVGTAHGGKPYIMDWKTSTSKGAHWQLQLAAYTELCRAGAGGSLRGVNLCAVMISAEKYTVCSCADVIPVAWAKFQSCLNVYKMMKG